MENHRLCAQNHFTADCELSSKDRAYIEMVALCRNDSGDIYQLVELERPPHGHLAIGAVIADCESPVVTAMQFVGELRYEDRWLVFLEESVLERLNKSYHSRPIGIETQSVKEALGWVDALATLAAKALAK